MGNRVCGKGLGACYCQGIVVDDANLSLDDIGRYSQSHVRCLVDVHDLRVEVT